MDLYHVWCNLKPGVDDLAFAADVAAWLDHLKAEGRLASYRITRRKLGLGPDCLPEWWIQIECRDLAQLDQAFQAAAARSGATEALHARVYAAVQDTRFALYRDFPDPGRVRDNDSEAEHEPRE